MLGGALGGPEYGTRAGLTKRSSPGNAGTVRQCRLAMHPAEVVWGCAQGGPGAAARGGALGGPVGGSARAGRAARAAHRAQLLPGRAAGASAPACAAQALSAAPGPQDSGMHQRLRHLLSRTVKCHACRDLLVAAGLVRDARARLRILERCSGRLENGRGWKARGDGSSQAV